MSCKEKMTAALAVFFILLAAVQCFFLANCFGEEPAARLFSREFSGTVILGRPDTQSMTASITAGRESQIYLIYGETAESEIYHTDTKTASEAEPAVFVMDKLQAGRTYYYSVCCRETGESQFFKSASYSFAMPKAAGTPFSFVVQSDSHLLNKADPQLYTASMHNMAALKPDFMFDLGDAFLIDNGGADIASLTQDRVNEIFRQQRPYWDIVTRNAPLFLTIGNHESEYGALLDGTKNNAAAMSTIARLLYYPNPVPNTFYSGNAETEPLFDKVQNYYAFTWGDALFVSIDPYRYSTNGASGDNKGDGWGWSLGKEQYDWFRKTLEQSTAKYKFVFAHHAIGNMRGGAAVAKLYEWGGYDQKGTYLFDQKRPGWGKPIQQIMKDTGVTVFFQGHDHLFAREDVDGVVYQTIPKPAEKIADHQDNFRSFTGDVLLNSGFLNVSISSSGVQVDYNRNYLVASGEQTTGIVYSYRVGADHSVTVLKAVKDDLSAYGKNAGGRESVKTGGNRKAGKAEGRGSGKSGGKKASAAGGGVSAFAGIGAVPATAMTAVPSGGFSFAVEADPHFDDNTDSSVLSQTAAEIISSKPAFLVDLGDASMLEKLGKTPAAAAERNTLVKNYFSQFGSLPVHMVTGNHDVQINTGNGTYYSFTQGTALFIVLDPYAYSKESAGRGGGWAVTLGKTQYDWLKQTLASSSAVYKFVFIHNLVGGQDKDCRGGAEAAAFYEWGGQTVNGGDEFAKMRPGWDMPIHQLLVKYGVNIVFHGHDHFYAEQEKDGIIYQLVPQPGSLGNSINDAPGFGYKSGVMLPSAGYLRVVVSPEKTVVEYIRMESGGKTSIPNVYSIRP